MNAAVLALLLLATPAQPTPEQLWATITNPAVPAAERARAAELAKDVLPPEYIPRLVAAQLHRRYSMREPQPDILAAIAEAEISTRGADGYTIVRDLPCGTWFERDVIVESLRQFPMTAESYGVVRNSLVAREDEFFARILPDWWTYAGEDDWNAAQAFIAEMAAEAEPEGVLMVSETIITFSRKLFDVVRMLEAMHPRWSDGPFPYTGFLAVADRIAYEPLHGGKECSLVYDAVRLTRIADDPPFRPDPNFQNAQECIAGLNRFRDWLDDHRGELEAGAGREVAAVTEARARMNRVSLCR